MIESPLPPAGVAGTRWFVAATIAATILLTVYGQVILKWRLAQLPPLPEPLLAKTARLAWLVFDPWIFSGFVAAFLASLAWMAALSKVELSVAYPFMSLNFVIVMLLGAWLLAEPLSWPKAIGVLLIVAGTVVASRG